jgi:hypothetical protein
MDTLTTICWVLGVGWVSVGAAAFVYACFSKKRYGPFTHMYTRAKPAPRTAVKEKSRALGADASLEGRTPVRPLGAGVSRARRRPHDAETSLDGFRAARLRA